MQIAQLVNNLDVSGGYQKLVIRSTQALEKLGHDVTIYTPSVDKKKCYPSDIARVKIVTLTNDEKGLPHVEKFKAIGSKLPTDLDALIIHDDLSLLSLAALPPNPHFTIAWMVNNQVPENLGNYRAELTHTMRHAGGRAKDKLRAARSKLTEVKLMRKGLKRVHIFATYDRFNQDLVRRQLNKKADFVAAGADLERFTKFAKGRTFDDKKRYELLSVGVLFPHRRYEDIIDAVAELTRQKLSVHATIVGLQDLSPDYFKKLREKVEKRDLQKLITFKHYVTDEEMTRLYKNSDAFLFINDGFTWGISVFEAVAAGLPVVITNNIGAADLIENGKTGWVVNPRAPKEVAKAVGEITTKRNNTKEISLRAAKELTAFVSWEAYSKRMLDLINKDRKVRLGNKV